MFLNLPNNRGVFLLSRKCGKTTAIAWTRSKIQKSSLPSWPRLLQNTVATQINVNLIPPKYFVAFAFVLIFIGTDDLSHSCLHRYFTPNLLSLSLS